jgi:hypothetical protein
VQHPPDPQMKRDARQGAPDFISHTQPNQNATARQILQLETAEIQTRRISRMFTVSFSMACTIAELAFAGCPR